MQDPRIRTLITSDISDLLRKDRYVTFHERFIQKLPYWIMYRNKPDEGIKYVETVFSCLIFKNNTVFHNISSFDFKIFYTSEISHKFNSTHVFFIRIKKFGAGSNILRVLVFFRLKYSYNIHKFCNSCLDNSIIDL